MTLAGEGLPALEAARPELGAFPLCQANTQWLLLLNLQEFQKNESGT